jgi:hypothetical protein
MKMMTRKALESFVITKQDFESYVNAFLTDDDWEVICDALDSSVADFVDNEVSYLVDDYKYGKGV